MHSSAHPSQLIDDSLTLADVNQRPFLVPVIRGSVPRPEDSDNPPRNQRTSFNNVFIKQEPVEHEDSDHPLRNQPASCHNMLIKQEPVEFEVLSTDEELLNVLMVEQILKSTYANHASRTRDVQSVESKLSLENKLRNVMLIENALKQMKREITDLPYIDSALQNVHDNMDESLSCSEEEDGQSSVQENCNVERRHSEEQTEKADRMTEMPLGRDSTDSVECKESEILLEDDSQPQATQDDHQPNIPSEAESNETIPQPDEHTEPLQKESNADTFQEGTTTEILQGGWNTDIFQDSANDNEVQNDFTTQTLQVSCNTDESQEGCNTNTFQNNFSTETYQEDRTTEDLQNCWNNNVTEDTVTFHNVNDTESFQFQDTHNSETFRNDWNADIFQEGQNTEISEQEKVGLTDIERALLSSPILVGDNFNAALSTFQTWMESQQDQSQQGGGVDVATSDSVREVGGEEEEEVTRSAKKLFAKRTKTLFHWLHPSDSKSELKVRVDQAWEQLSQRESEFYYSQVLGPFNHRQVKPMVNPRIFELLGLPASLLPSTTGLPPMLASLPLEPLPLPKHRNQSTRHKHKHHAADAPTDAVSTIDADADQPAKKRAKRAMRGPYKTTSKRSASSDGAETYTSRSRGKVGRPKKRKRRSRKEESDEDSDYHLSVSRKEKVVMDISLELQQCDKILDSDSDW